MVSTPFANYTAEQTLFRELVHNDDAPNILLFQGESGCGKSQLLQHCLQTHKQTPTAFMQLRSGSEAIPTLFNLMGRQQGWANLPLFTGTVANLTEQPDKVADPVWQMGMERHLGEIGKISDLESRLSRYQLLTDAWFADALQFDKPLLLVVDTYENASTLFDRWFSDDFLAGVAHSRQMRVAVSGQNVPEPREAWSFCASRRELKGIHEAQAWLVWAEAAGYQLPSLEWMAGVITALKGNPSQIIQVITTTAPQRVGPIPTKETVYSQRKQLRQNMTNAFNLEELRNICFDLEIEYENLSNHTQRDAFVRELIAYTQRVGRLAELVDVLRAERPHLSGRRMDNDWLTRLSHAQSDDERAAIVLQMSLAALPPALQAVAQAAAIPHWFDAQFLEALLGEAGDEWYDSLLTLNFVEQSPGRGYAVHERTRRQLLHNLWRDDPARFRALSGKAADYCVMQASETQQTSAWQTEAVYHRLVSDPEAGVAELRDLATRWANYEFHTYDQIEATIRLAQEQIAAGRLTGDGANWTRLWQARLALLYGRADLATAPLAEITIQPADDPYLAAELAQTQGDILAHTNDRDGMAAAWNAAYDLYRQQAEPQGQLDAYLLAEKMRQHGLSLPAAEEGEDTAAKTPPTSTALRLIDNISAAWIEGVLQPALQQTIDLRFARDGARPTNLVFHRPLTLDRPVAAGQRLSRLFAAAGESLLILGAPGSGKTITLLQLLDELLQAARADARAPIPLLFNLSSFAAFSQEKGATFTNWLIEQANTQYRLKRETAREWLATGDRFVLLLDGLDEVRNEAGKREQCITAINDFMRQMPCGLVVCSRIGDYQTLQNRLELAHALVLQPLGNRQIEAFIQQIESPDRAAMAQRIADDWQLREALRSPLLLNLYPQAFAALPPTLDAGDTVETRRQALFAAHVTTAFARPVMGKAKDSVGDKEQSIGWLTFLANRMQQMGTSLFYVESLQPTWLPTKLIGRYRVLYGLYFGLIIGLFIGLFYGLIVWLNVGLLYGLSYWLEQALNTWLILGLRAGAIGGTIGGLIGGITGGGTNWLTTWLPKRWWKVSAVGILGGLSVGLLFALSATLIGGPNLTMTGGLLVGPIAGVGFIVSLGISSLVFDIQLREQVKPIHPSRQRIDRYLQQGLRLGLIVGSTMGLLFGLGIGLFSGLNAGILSGLLLGSLSGLLSGLLGVIMAFIDTPIIDDRQYPGRGVHASLRNACIITTSASLLLSLPVWFIDQSINGSLLFPFFILVNILPPTFTWFGGLAWCQHEALRFVLARQGWLPWRLVPWLEEMATRGLLRRVGSGYIFIHRSLLEYFAALEGPHALGEPPASRQATGRAAKTDQA